jgi:hypothetical protein
MGDEQFNDKVGLQSITCVLRRARPRNKSINHVSEDEAAARFCRSFGLSPLPASDFPVSQNFGLT